MVGVNFILRPQRMPPTFRNNTMAIMNSFVDELSERHWPDLRIQTLKKAAKLILVEEPDDPSRPYVYIGGKSKVNHAAVFYTMRPHPVYSKIIDKNLEKIFPKDFNPENALGLPIRGENIQHSGRDKYSALSEILVSGLTFWAVRLVLAASDKCIRESECLSFDQVSYHPCFLLTANVRVPSFSLTLFAFLLIPVYETYGSSAEKTRPSPAWRDN